MYDILIYDGVMVDIALAADYYESQAPFLGLKFKHRVEEEITRIAYHPYIYQVAFDDVRRSLIPRFPYAIAYRVVNNTVLIDGIISTKASPKRLQKMLEERRN